MTGRLVVSRLPDRCPGRRTRVCGVVTAIVSGWRYAIRYAMRAKPGDWATGSATWWSGWIIRTSICFSPNGMTRRSGVGSKSIWIWLRAVTDVWPQAPGKGWCAMRQDGCMGGCAIVSSRHIFCPMCLPGINAGVCTDMDSRSCCFPLGGRSVRATENPMGEVACPFAWTVPE